MANYNTFIAQATKGRRTMLVTSSARKVKALLAPGIRVEVWSENHLTETIYTKTRSLLDKYVEDERQHIREKQKQAEKRNQARRARADARSKR